MRHTGRAIGSAAAGRGLRTRPGHLLLLLVDRKQVPQKETMPTLYRELLSCRMAMGCCVPCLRGRSQRRQRHKTAQADGGSEDGPVLQLRHVPRARPEQARRGRLQRLFRVQEHGGCIWGRWKRSTACADASSTSLPNGMRMGHAYTGTTGRGSSGAPARTAFCLGFRV